MIRASVMRWPIGSAGARMVDLAWCLGPARAVALAACGHGAADGVRAIDWQNRTYELEGLGAVTVEDGRADFEIDDSKINPSGGTPGSFRVEPPLFADIDGDGAQDAVVTSVLGTGGTGKFSQVVVYTVRGGKVVAIGEVPGGDRGDGGIRHVALDNNANVVDTQCAR